MPQSAVTWTAVQTAVARTTSVYVKWAGAVTSAANDFAMRDVWNMVSAGMALATASRAGMAGIAHSVTEVIFLGFHCS